MADPFKLRALERERLALEFVVAYIAREGYPPKLREIGDAQDPVWSKSKCSDTLRRLASKGYLELGGAGEARAIKVLRPVDHLELELAELEGVRVRPGSVPA